MIIAETRTDSRILSRILTGEGCRIRTAVDCRQAMEAAADKAPDLILLDNRMSGMDCFDRLLAPKGRLNGRGIPMILLIGDASDKGESYRLGAADYIARPYDASEVLARVKAHLALGMAMPTLEADNRRLRKERDELERRNAELMERLRQSAPNPGSADEARVEDDAIHGEKMHLVGGLARRMAHEINNPLAGIMQTADVMAFRLGGKSETPANLKAARAAGVSMDAIRSFMEARSIPRMLATINKSARRLASIVNDMLCFTRKSEARTPLHDIEKLLDQTLELAATDAVLEKQYDFKTIEIVKDFEESLPFAPCEGARIQQVLLDLLRNGARAMRESGTENPRFTIRTRFEKSRGMVCMEIEDNGPGMDEETRKRAFEPFFTTKRVGTGAGLGLSMSNYIITENHGGEMTVESRPGAGARWFVRLPLKRKVGGRGSEV